MGSERVHFVAVANDTTFSARTSMSSYREQKQACLTINRKKRAVLWKLFRSLNTGKGRRREGQRQAQKKTETLYLSGAISALQEKPMQPTGGSSSPRQPPGTALANFLWEPAEAKTSEGGSGGSAGRGKSNEGEKASEERAKLHSLLTKEGRYLQKQTSQPQKAGSEQRYIVF